MGVHQSLIVKNDNNILERKLGIYLKYFNRFRPGEKRNIEG